jgi:carotenoid 1,2-hydratase
MDDLGFTLPVPRNGYRWWYVDALSDDGRHGLTIIAFIGSVFSPWYARARRRGAGDPMNHCAFNVAVYGPGGRWALAERERGTVARTASTLRIGPSAVHWDGRKLVVDIDEIGVPLPRRLRGRVTIDAAAARDRTYPLDANGDHRWHPIAPASPVTVAFANPSLAWSGTAYLDSNSGDCALENTFQGWDWCRAPLPDGAAALLYDTVERDGTTHGVSLHVAADGTTTTFDPPALGALPASGWRVQRRARSEAPQGATVVKTLEDTPFYARSLVGARLFGADTVAVHESLSMERFTSGWVQILLPFRIRKHRGGG